MMKRREYIGMMGRGLVGATLVMTGCRHGGARDKNLLSDLVIIGGGLGGCACALSALRSGLQVIMTEETDWIGGQLTSQGVPPDEHRWIETVGCTRTYRELRNAIRDYYKKHYKLSKNALAQEHLNPGGGSVSRLCHEPKVALHCLEEMLAPYISSGQLKILKNTRAIAADVYNDRVRMVEVLDHIDGNSIQLEGKMFVDATELGDLLPLTECEHVIGTEGKRATGELHMPEKASEDNQQAFTMCFAVDYLKDTSHVIDKPENYDYWKDYIPDLTPPWPGRLLDFTYTHPPTGLNKILGFNPEGPNHSGIINLWTYRRILAASQFEPDSGIHDTSLINWPQNDYMDGNLVGASEEERLKHIQASKQLSLSLLYWLQTEAPRKDGGSGWPGLRLRPDLMGTKDGLAKSPYIRESRRIKALTTIYEHHCGVKARQQVLGTNQPVEAEHYKDTVGIGHYPIDLHPTSGGDNYIDFPTLPFEIPLGALIPQRIQNLIAANKNIGTTHVTNGCYRLHPIEWNIGEVAGMLAASSMKHNTPPSGIQSSNQKLENFQQSLVNQGIELRWPEHIRSINP